VYWGGLHTEGGLIVRQMRDAGVTATLMSGDGITDSEFAAIGGPAVEGTLMTFPPEPRNRPEAAAVVKAFKEVRKFDPQAYTLYTYSAVEIIAQAATAIKSVDPKAIAAEMRGGKKGDITRPDYVMYTWKKGADGKITYVQN
jgi:branched-chain amino acid transport system substrate-binding protein